VNDGKVAMIIIIENDLSRGQEEQAKDRTITSSISCSRQQPVKRPALRKGGKARGHCLTGTGEAVQGGVMKLTECTMNG
jgi:hypothetical protein